MPTDAEARWVGALLPSSAGVDLSSRTRGSPGLPGPWAGPNRVRQRVELLLRSEEPDLPAGRRGRPEAQARDGRRPRPDDRCEGHHRLRRHNDSQWVAQLEQGFPGLPDHPVFGSYDGTDTGQSPRPSAGSWPCSSRLRAARLDANPAHQVQSQGLVLRTSLHDAVQQALLAKRRSSRSWSCTCMRARVSTLTP